MQNSAFIQLILRTYEVHTVPGKNITGIDDRCCDSCPRVASASRSLYLELYSKSACHCCKTDEASNTVLLLMLAPVPVLKVPCFVAEDLNLLHTPEP